MVSSGTLALFSDGWFIRVFNSDHFFRQAIHLNTGLKYRDHLCFLAAFRSLLGSQRKLAQS